MRIVVPIKQVPETGAVRMDEKTGTMIREGVEAIVNPLDLYGLELAIRIKEGSLGAAQGPSAVQAPSEPWRVAGVSPPPVEIITITMGPPKADRAIREAVAMGCDGGVLISDRAFAGSDTWATSYALAGAIRKIGDVDLVIAGERATDGDTGQVGPGIAAFLDWPVVTYVSKVRRIDQGRVLLERLVEDGREVIEMLLPGVITVVKEIGDPRLPTLRGKQRAKKLSVPTWGPDEMGLDRGKLGLNGSPTRVVKIFKPTVARQCEKIPVTDQESALVAVERVVEFLKEKQLL
jgi:electron transfer flavoprotein beta subunit